MKWHAMVRRIARGLTSLGLAAAAATSFGPGGQAVWAQASAPTVTNTGCYKIVQKAWSDKGCDCGPNCETPRYEDYLEQIWSICAAVPNYAPAGTGQSNCIAELVRVGVRMPCYHAGWDTWNVVECVVAAALFTLSDALLILATGGVGVLIAAIEAAGSGILTIAACQYCRLAICSANENASEYITNQVNAVLSGSSCP